MKPYTITYSNRNDYEDMLEMMLKFNAPLVTIHKGNVKSIICFGKQATLEYIFNGNELFDVKANTISFLRWVTETFVLHEKDDSVVTIYNK